MRRAGVFCHDETMRQLGQSMPAPTVSPLWMRWFSRYAERYVRRHFHSLRVLNAPPPVSTNPLVIYLNHASWWDPMICLALRNRFFPQRTSFAPIDAAALAKYRFFRKLGFFPVEHNSRRGALDFLNSAGAVLVRNDAALWLTPQGRFTDVRERPLRLRAGLAHLSSRVRVATYLPLAIEFVYWEERLPEVCANFGEPLVLAGEQAERFGSRVLTQQFQHRLQSAQDELAEAVIKRDGHKLRPLITNATGVGGIYDLWRRTRALLRGETFQLEHARK